VVPSVAIALTALGGAVLLLIAAVVLVARGAGMIATLRQDLKVLETALEQLEVRHTREVKTRAGLTRAENAVEEKTITEEARAILEKQTPVVPFPARPKRIFRRN